MIDADNLVAQHVGGGATAVMNGGGMEMQDGFNDNGEEQQLNQPRRRNQQHHRHPPEEDEQGQAQAKKTRIEIGPRNQARSERNSSCKQSQTRRYISSVS